MIKSILLMTPPYHTGIIEISGNWPPLNLVYLAGHLRQAGFQVEIYDAMTKNHTLAEVRSTVANTKPDAVLIGAFTPCANAAVDVLSAVKEIDPKIITVLGGLHASFCYEELLGANSCIDFIVRGEAEITVVELLTTINLSQDLTQTAGIAYLHQGNVIATAERNFADNLDDLLPAWDLLDWNDYFYKITDRRLALVGSSRGCPHKCKFCSQHLFWRGSYRERSPESFVAEVEHLHKTFGVGMFMLADEYSTLSRQRWEAILDLLLEKQMDVHFSMETRVNDILRDHDILWKYRAAGFIHIYVGVETVKQQTLDYYGKNLTVQQSKEAIELLNNAGIVTECSFILGQPDETAESIDTTLDQALMINPDFAHFLVITPWPYTDLYRELSAHVVEHDYSKYHFVHPVVKPLALSTDELWKKIINCFRVFYTAKTKQCLTMEDRFKRSYMLKSIEIMHREFFTGSFGHRTIELPRDMGHEIKEVLSKNKPGEKITGPGSQVSCKFGHGSNEGVIAVIEACATCENECSHP